MDRITDKIPLIMLPGWGMEPNIFKPLENILIKYFKLIGVSFDNTIDLPQFKQKVTDVIENSVSNSFWLLGWSLGSLAALETALSCKKNIAGMILFGATSCFTSKSEDNYNFGTHRIIVERMKKRLSVRKDQTLKDFYTSMFSEIEINKGYLDIFLKASGTYCHTNEASLTAGLDYLIQTDLRNNLKNIKIPSLLINGNEDTICPKEASMFIKNNMAGSVTLKTIENTGHIPFFTVTQECSEQIYNFLTEQII